MTPNHAVTSLLARSAGDEEPLVNAWINRSRRQVLALGDIKLARVNSVGRVRDSDISAAESC